MLNLPTASLPALRFLNLLVYKISISCSWLLLRPPYFVAVDNSSLRHGGAGFTQGVP